MEYFAGPLWVDGEEREGWVAAEGGRLVDQGQGEPPGAAVAAVLLEGVYNFHTHLGDAFMAGERLPRDLAELVAPGTGLKHRRLAAADASTVRQGIERQLDASVRAGVCGIVDFREQGPPGLENARAAHQGRRIDLHLLGRPTDAPASAAQVEELLRLGQGIGVPSLTDWGQEACAALAEAAHRRHKAFALHASERDAEPMEDVLALEPDLLVHLGAASRGELRLVADEGVPVAVCPSSNEFFHVPCAAATLTSMGVPWFLGTDNAMLGAVDPVDEARRLRGRHPDLAEEELFRALTTRPETAVSALAPQDGTRGRPPRLRVLRRNEAGSVQWDAPPLVLERAP